MAEKTQQELFDEQYDADVESVMKSAAGRRFVWSLLSQTRVFASSFHTNGSMVMMREGMRQIGLQLMQDVQQYPDLFLKMWTENVNEETFAPNEKASLDK